MAQETTSQSGLTKQIAALLSLRFVESRRRVFRQLIDSLIYEGIVEPLESTSADGKTEFRLLGTNEEGQGVLYICRGRRKLSFGRIRLSQEPVIRVKDGIAEEAVDLALMLVELTPSFAEEPKRLGSFICEVEQTLLNDAAALYDRDCRTDNGEAIEDLGYDDLEGEVLDGHPYHPCFKSRIGFDPEDNAAYGPEFKSRFRLLWIALKVDDAEVSASRSIRYRDFMEEEIGTELYCRFEQRLTGQGLNPEDYVWLPVHPWQWRKKAVRVLFRHIRERRIVMLGEGKDEYTPQQSIRTLGNRTRHLKSNVKTSLSITNTSALRILGTHHILNAPALSDWLDSVVQGDDYLRDEARMVVLKEVLGVAFRYDKLAGAVRGEAYGTIGAVWRESINVYCEEGEAAVPVTALCHVKADGSPFIDRWIGLYGLNGWLQELLRVTIDPLVHMLYVHGIALESHAQNMVLLHRQGIPTRIAVKDLPGGIRYRKRLLSEEASPGLLRQAEGGHANGYASSPMETDDPAAIRDFLLDSVFHIHLTELCFFLEEYYGMEERVFWKMVAGQINRYLARLGSNASAFVEYDLFERMIEVGQLTIRRLCGEHAQRDHTVINPLSMFKE